MDATSNQSTRRPARPTTGSAPPHPLAFALTLTGLAGFLDAAAFVRFNHLYVSFMSGNSTHLGMSVGEGAVPAILALLGVVSAFVAGATMGTWIADHAGRRVERDPTRLINLVGESPSITLKRYGFSHRTGSHADPVWWDPALVPCVLGLEAALLAAALGALLASLPLACVMIVALTMGIQNVLHQAVGGVDVGKGFVTGMLFHLGQSLARLRSGRATPGNALTLLANWLSFVGGAALGTLAVHGLGFAACLLAGMGQIALLMLILPLSRARS